MKNDQKKGELTTQQIVMIIILLVSFAILLFFIYKLNFQDLSEKQICQSSIQLAGKNSFFSKIDCKTSYVCISGGDACKNFNYKTTIKIDLNAKDGGKKETMKAIANEMADCWWMFGEGKRDYSEWKALSETVCAVCTEFAFDDKIISGGITISHEDFYNYLKTTKRSDSETKNYLQLIYSGLGVLESKYIPSGGINLNKKYGIYTGRVEPGKISSWLPGVKDIAQPINPILLERDKSSEIGCTSFVTTP